jgi:Prokaryotic E2 family E
MRRVFHLPEDDVEQLDALGVEWETIREPNGQWLLLHGVAFPQGYNHPKGSVAIQIPGNYPVAPLDMAYFFPHLQRMDGQPLRQTQCTMQVDGKAWQRWSRHYSWLPGQHNIGTHIVLVRHWLEHGVGRG